MVQENMTDGRVVYLESGVCQTQYLSAKASQSSYRIITKHFTVGFTSQEKLEPVSDQILWGFLFFNPRGLKHQHFTFKQTYCFPLTSAWKDQSLRASA